ncbi:PqqD family protein [Streptococcus ruminantium]|uniref:PqqD family protein n=1 Tax=Streptococcus ruminantium TaxID=1917441 RepID=UPI001F335B98|nr:PqqD family protein [Streptococcus ruminantium]BDD39550.1 hypothetical protein GUT183_17880 [Streptococcus ruminantium]BDD41455.1 hypothetical protein GUT184_17190 [Streptococcus ruminantium]
MYILSNKISWQTINSYIYIVNEDTGKVYYLDHVSKRIWEAIYSSLDIEEVIKELSDYYSLEKSKIQQEVYAFLKNLIEEGLLNETE